MNGDRMFSLADHSDAVFIIYISQDALTRRGHRGNWFITKNLKCEELK
jgi:hypothetical protein